MRPIFLSILVIFSQLSYSLPKGRPVIGLAESASIEEFQAYLKSRPSVSLAQWIQQQTPSDKLSTELFDRFKMAQESYFQANPSESKSAFEKVLELLPRADWNSSQRKILFISAFRAAELSDSELEKQAFLNAALSASVLQAPDSSIFPPPLIQLFDRIKSNSIVEVSVPQNLHDAERLSVSDQVIYGRKKSKLLFPRGEVLVTAYSSRWGKVEKVLSARDFSDWSPNKTSLFRGTCSSTSNKPDWNHPFVDIVYFNKDCVVSKSGNISIKALNPLNSAMNSAQPHKSVNFTQATVNSKVEKPWWKNKWIWIGVGGAAAAIMVYENNKSTGGSDSAPTTVYE